MLLCHLEDNNEENDAEVCSEVKESGDVDVQGDVKRLERQGRISLSQHTKLRNLDILLPVNEFACDYNSTPKINTVSNDNEPNLRKVEIRSSAHIGAGDSVQKIDTTNEPSIEKMNELSDA